MTAESVPSDEESTDVVSDAKDTDLEAVEVKGARAAGAGAEGAEAKCAGAAGARAEGAEAKCAGAEGARAEGAETKCAGAETFVEMENAETYCASGM